MPENPTASERRVIPLAPRQLLAIVAFAVAVGFLLGFWTHRPLPHGIAPEVLAAMQKVNRDAQHVIEQQQQLYNCQTVNTSGLAPPAQAAPPAPTDKGSR